MSRFFSQVPLVRIAIPFIVGVISATYFNLDLSNTYFSIYFLLLIIILLVFIVNKSKYHYDKRWIFGCLVHLFLFFAGNVIAINHNDLNKPSHFSNYLEQEGYSILKITEPASERRNSFRVECKVKKIIFDTIAFKVDGKVMLYLEKDSLASTLSYGDYIITNNNYYSVSPPQNPHQFNYKRFLSFSNIHHQGYRRSGNYELIERGNGNVIKSKALYMRERAMATLQANNIGDREFAVLSALLLGYRDLIDDDLRQKFAGAGAMHILCVSGLHVGIIYLILNSMFSFFNKIKKGKYIKTFIVILLIWFYATLTGFSPSVLRASTMFTFVAIAGSLNRQTNIYNTLAASALILILTNPFIVTKIGFQLSYFAVISIVSIQPYLYKSIYFNNKLSNKIWAIVTVSIAAQLGTGPLALYYFNQFPNYFILTNLAVIPLASIIIYTALSFLILSPINIVADLLGKILSFFVYLMHKSVHLIEKLPFSTLQNVNLSLHEVLMILSVIILLTCLFAYKSKLCLKLALPAILIIALSIGLKNINTQTQKSIVVYSVNNHTAIDFISGSNSVFIASEGLLSEGNNNIDFNITQNRINMGVKNVDTKVSNCEHNEFSKESIWIKNNYYLFGNKRIKILTKQETLDINTCDSINKLDLDYIIITHSPRIDVGELKQLYNFETIIFDSSNSYWQINRWIEECNNTGVNYWSTRHHGAFVKNF